jgi:hypothetical protein
MQERDVDELAPLDLCPRRRGRVSAKGLPELDRLLWPFDDVRKFRAMQDAVRVQDGELGQTLLRVTFTDSGRLWRWSSTWHRGLQKLGDSRAQASG